MVADVLAWGEGRGEGMTTKEKVIREAIKRNTKRLEKVDSILDANPLSEICDIRIEAQKILTEHKGDNKKIMELIEPLADKEKKLFALAKRQTKDSSKLIDEKVKLQVELGDLNNELYWITRAA